MALLVKVVPDVVSTCPLMGLASEPQSITTNQKEEIVVNCVDSEVL